VAGGNKISQAEKVLKGADRDKKYTKVLLGPLMGGTKS